MDLSQLDRPTRSLVQRGLAQAGHYTGTYRGIGGPMTEAAYAKFLAAWRPGGVTLTFADHLIAVAATQLGIREVSRNQHPKLQKFWDATSYKEGMRNREPWCAAYLCWVVAEAHKRKEVGIDLPTSARVYDWEPWARRTRNKSAKLLKAGTTVRRGDIIIFDFSHIALATSDQVGRTYDTIEGNTNRGGSPEGDGVYAKTRGVARIRSIIRIS